MAEDQLKDVVIGRALADESLSEDVQYVILAALESADELAAVLHEGTAKQQATKERLTAPAPAEVEATGTFIRSITVQGFRGIGEQIRLSLPGQPGLVVVAGRNGSGKSSLAEALEMALTGVNKRWETKNKNDVWSRAWRNLHAGVAPEVRVVVTEEGTGSVTIGIDWSSDAAAPVSDQTRWVDRTGHKRAPFEALGWQRALELYRPLLSYDELGSILEGQPKDFYDQLFRLLGLEQLTEAIGRLDDEVRQLKVPESTFRAAKSEAKSVLQGVDDPKAQTLAKEVNRNVPHPEEIRPTVVAGAGESVPAAWRVAAALTVPSADDVDAATGELERALAAVADQTDAQQTLAADQLRLLEAAMGFHRDHGDGSCPVCDTGQLDAEWLQQAKNQVSAARTASSALAAVRTRLDEARSVARRLIEGIAVVPQHSELTTAPAAAAAHKSATALLDVDDRQLLRDLPQALTDVRDSYAALAAEAVQLSEARRDDWTLAVEVLARWLTAADEFLVTAGARQRATAAQKWLNDNAEQIRNERLKPMSDRSGEIWSVLRQESNVQLGDIKLSGAKNLRRVTLSAAVDGSDTEAFSVMSQGELHALALAVFLPRATAAASPFRFVVLDDPIQAMDPSKIDGFLQVLIDLAEHRQVIVLTHDDRLPAAIRRQNVPARMYEVSRQSGSRISITEATRPATRLLDDAKALLRDGNVSNEVKSRVIPTLCREAVEAAARDVFATKALAIGKSLDWVEQTWTEAKTTRSRVTLALHLDATADISSWVKGYREGSLRVAAKGVHEGAQHVQNAVDDTKRTIEDLRKLLL
ncbi:AAA family ATPase [Nakamurella aerolata]|uniref:Nuclease SbcCD subunit C n=1 Tax=Nakamurella aerolata TaxID=1656892 RepID=A0A849ABV8_9ACTN|nr:AAA family ATPase [Nakamurella aerolata]